MSFDWTSFATGFAERTSERWDERKDKAEDYEKAQRSAAERNIALISRRRQIADQVTGYAAALKQNGVSDDQIQAIVSSGPDSISKAMTQISKAVEANGGRPLGATDVDTVLNLPDNFEPIDMTTDEFIRNTYGLATPTRTSEKEEEVGFLDKLTGTGAMQQARSRLANEPMAAGMSVQEINDAARNADYQTLIPGSFVTYSGLDVFNPAKDSDGFLRSLNLQIKAAQETPEFTAIQAEIDSLKFDKDLNEDARTSKVDELRRKQQLVLKEVVGPTIDSYVETYGESFTDPMGSYVSRVLGPDYFDVPSAASEPVDDDLLTAVRNGLRDEPTLEETVVPESDGLEPATATSITVPEVITTELPSDEQAPVVEVVEAAEQSDTYTQMSEQGVDDVSITLLQSNGTELLDYLREQGVTSEEEIAVKLNEWGQENGKTMPFDKSALIYALTPHLLNK